MAVCVCVHAQTTASALRKAPLSGTRLMRIPPLTSKSCLMNIIVISYDVHLPLLKSPKFAKKNNSKVSFRI